MRVISFSCGGEGTAYASATGERGGEARTRRRGRLGVANVALCAALVGGLGGCGAPPSEPAEQVAIQLAKAGDGGQINIQWGDMELSTDFKAK